MELILWFVAWLLIAAGCLGLVYIAFAFFDGGGR